VAPKIAGGRTNTDRSVVERRPIRMECDVSGVPPPAVTWTQDGVRVSAGGGRRLLEGGRVLLLSATLVEDAGVYVCTARSVAGTDRKQFRLRVLGIVAYTQPTASHRIHSFSSRVGQYELIPVQGHPRSSI